ncbi:hypothetical protein [Micromonospora endolithica]|uniref:hypothetical protein n=1 Tax=Micromonospora endolithica TaxID=230091 RepID=UPI0011ACB281|nr:hypothetical protein [Micromonospora endolithica]TWJ20289.1 hypothetical protein JD76_00387 [Micromonospora endolithica]
MATPEYVQRMRRHIGTDLRWLPRVSAVVGNDAGEPRLGLRADDGRWSVVSGIASALGVTQRTLETGRPLPATAAGPAWFPPAGAAWSESPGN